MLEQGVKKQLIGTSIIAAGIVGLSFPMETYADESSKELMNEKESLEKKMDATRIEIEQTEKQIERMENQFERTEMKIKHTEKEIKDTEERIEKRAELLGNRLSTLQVEGDQTYLDVLFGATGFGDFVSRLFTVNKIMSADQELLEAQKTDHNELQSQKESLEENKQSLHRQFKIMQDKLGELEGKKAEQELLIGDLDVKIEDAKEREALEKQREEWKQLSELQRSKFSTLSIEDLEKNNEEVNKALSKQELENNQERAKVIETTLEEARKYLGGQYVWGGDHPSTSFDCSGYTQWSFKQAGVNIPRTAAQQYLHTERIDASNVKVGDLVFFSYGSGISHVGIYIGNGKMMNAQNSGIQVADLNGYWDQYIVGFGRVPTL